MHTVKIITTRSGTLVELNGEEIRGADVAIRVKGGRVLATITLAVDDFEMDADVEAEDLISRGRLHSFRLVRGQAFLDGRPVNADNVQVNPSPDGESGTIDLESIPVLFEKKENS